MTDAKDPAPFYIFANNASVDFGTDRVKVELTCKEYEVVCDELRYAAKSRDMKDFTDIIVNSGLPPYIKTDTHSEINLTNEVGGVLGVVKFHENPDVPPGELWFMGVDGKVQGKMTNLGTDDKTIETCKPRFPENKPGMQPFSYPGRKDGASSDFSTGGAYNPTSREEESRLYLEGTDGPPGEREVIAGGLEPWHVVLLLSLVGLIAAVLHK